MDNNIKDYLNELKNGKSGKIQSSLGKVNEVLEKYYKDGGRDFSISNVINLLEKYKILKKSSIVNNTGLHYRLLIEKWRSLVNPDKVNKQKTKIYSLGSYERLIREKIHDQALQIVLIQLLVEKNSLERKLKSFTDKFDGQPRYILDTKILKLTEQDSFSNFSSSINLSSIELEAIKDATNNNLNLTRKFWSVQSNGSVYDSNNERIYKVGYVSAMEKIINALINN